MPGNEQLALDSVSLSVPIGSRTALVGPNGAGKSTLLKAIVGILKPRAGSIRIYGMPVGTCLHRVAYLPQRDEIDWRFPLTVRGLIETGRYVHLGWLRRPGSGDRRLVQREIDRLRLTELADRQIGQLSGGQQQRSLLARALVQGADLLLLDEPMNAVDAETRSILTGVLDDLREEGKTAIIATHDIGRLESDFDDVLFMADGHEVTAAEAMATETGHRHATV
jgi:manganese/zinc/iron transport system ATP- binding protein